jgi:hypothetical protein
MSIWSKVDRSVWVGINLTRIMPPAPVMNGNPLVVSRLTQLPAREDPYNTIKYFRLDGNSVSETQEGNCEGSRSSSRNATRASSDSLSDSSRDASRTASRDASRTASRDNSSQVGNNLDQNFIDTPETIVASESDKIETNDKLSEEDPPKHLQAEKEGDESIDDKEESNELHRAQPMSIVLRRS